MKLLFVFGTRPEAIKLAPLINLALKDARFETKVCVTGQHREMLDQVLSIFEIQPDFDLNLMKSNQSLSDITSGVLQGMATIFSQWRPDRVIVHGDTSTSFSASLAAFYGQIPVSHVEAGLRTGDLYAPWPEELNRRLTAVIANQHFAPTLLARSNLINESIAPSNIFVVGNTIVDAVHLVSDRITSNQTLLESLNREFDFLDPTKKLILVTGHRRENLGEGMSQLCEALLILANRNDVQIVFPVHLNPNVQNTVYKMLSGQKNIFLMPPLEYLPFAYLMLKAHHLLTDSGGIQEEAVTLKKPVLITRDVTERPEAVAEDGSNLVGMKLSRILEASNKLLDNDGYYTSMSSKENPFGDGKSSQKILEAMYQNL